MTIGYGVKDFKNMKATLLDVRMRLKAEDSSRLAEIVKMLDTFANGLEENQEICFSDSGDIPEVFVR